MAYKTPLALSGSTVLIRSKYQAFFMSLRFKGDKPKKPKKKRERQDDDEVRDEDLEIPADYTPDPIPGMGKLTSSGVVIMGYETDFPSQIQVGDTLLVTVSDRFRNTTTDETRVVNMVLGKSARFRAMPCMPVKASHTRSGCDAWLAAPRFSEHRSAIHV